MPGFAHHEATSIYSVCKQDFAVCKRVQRGVRSRAFTHGLYAQKDELPLAFKHRYLAARDAAGA